MTGKWDLWGPAGQEWLERNLARRWTEEQELYLRDTWDQSEDWVLECHPRIALLLLVREYLQGSRLCSEVRLRKLIRIVAKVGISHQLVAALSLLGLLLLDSGGWGSDVEVLYHQILDESVQAGTLESALRQFFLAQAAVLQGRTSAADELYAQLVNEPVGFAEVSGWLLGRVYEKLALYLLREPAHSLLLPWRLAVQAWCAYYPDTDCTVRLHQLLQEMQGMASPTHPIRVWTTGSEGAALPPGNPAIDYGWDRELEVIVSLLNAKQSGTEETVEMARLLARKYGDPYWIQRAEELRRAPVCQNPIEPIDLTTPQYRFTYFDLFQGYGEQDAPLFPKRYGRRKVKQLLALLLLQPHYRMVKEILLQHLFGEEVQSQKSENYLHVIIHRLRDLFQKQSGQGGDWITIRDGMVLLNEDRIQGVDVQEYRKLVSVGRQLYSCDQEAALELYQRASRMYRNVIAPEFEYEDWMQTMRMNITLDQQKILRALRDAARRKGSPDEAVFYGEALLAVDEWDLSALQQLCQDLAGLGERKRTSLIREKYITLLQKDHEDIPSWLVNLS